jgi:hypothetical protein
MRPMTEEKIIERFEENEDAIKEYSKQVDSLKRDVASLKEDARTLVKLVKLLGIGTMEPMVKSNQTLEKGRNARDDFRQEIQGILQKYELED